MTRLSTFLGLMVIVMVARKGEGQGFDVNMLLVLPNYSTFLSLVKTVNFTHKDFPSSFTIFAANNDALKASPHTLSLVSDIFTYLFIRIECLGSTNQETYNSKFGS